MNNNNIAQIKLTTSTDGTTLNTKQIVGHEAIEFYKREVFCIIQNALLHTPLTSRTNLEQHIICEGFLRLFDNNTGLSSQATELCHIINSLESIADNKGYDCYRDYDDIECEFSKIEPDFHWLHAYGNEFIESLSAPVDYLELFLTKEYFIPEIMLHCNHIEKEMPF